MITRRTIGRLIFLALLVGIATIGIGVKELETPISVSEVTCTDKPMLPGDYCEINGRQFSYDEMKAKEIRHPQKTREGIALIAFGSAAIIGFIAWSVRRFYRNRRAR